ncbi:unnamed protein product [Hydatigera taeniaeformis]|uniref:DUF5745 domain-containing protein n=1 Tax=Hydatigena taeniaeformis TaxID=6205 RepID=A0A0R3X1Q8_HYDTA|nr:unnamed protein product [Hydatigera taeniaeformis]
MSGVSCSRSRSAVRSGRGLVKSVVPVSNSHTSGSEHQNSSGKGSDADYFVRVYADIFGMDRIPYPNAHSAEQRFFNIEAIEKDIESRFDVTLSHIPPCHVVDRVSTAVEDLNEIMENIDFAKRAHKCISAEAFVSDMRRSISPEIPRGTVNENLPPCSEKPLCGKPLYRHLANESFALISPPTALCEQSVPEIVKNSSPKSPPDSGVTAVAPKPIVFDLNGPNSSFDAVSFLSEKIREARSQAALLCGLCTNRVQKRWTPELCELRNCLIKLGGDIEATVAAIDTLSPNPLDLLDPDTTTATSIPTDLDEVAELYRLNTECERVLAEKKKLMLDSVTHCVRQLKGAINPLPKNMKNATT